MIARLINAMGLLLVGTMAGLYAYWLLPAGWWFAVVSIGTLALFILGLLRVKSALRGLLRGSFSDPGDWLALIALPVLIACIARMTASIMASVLALAGFNLELWRQHGPDSFTGFIAALAGLGLLMLQHQRRLNRISNRREVEEDGEREEILGFPTTTS